ncbi:CAIB BAIF family enzyme [Aspergillus sp. HF37]|nr:CAIB BAIF family enzyme [Aspergillus sp. HF37]
MYSPVEEAQRIFEFLCDRTAQLNISSAAAQIKDRVSFNTAHDRIYYPIPLKVTETLAALKGVEGAVAAALGDVRFGPSPDARKVSVNLEKATAFGFQALVAKVDGLSRTYPGVKAKLKDTDIHSAQSNLYRRLAANLYRTKNESEFFHLHGCLNPTATLNMIGLDGYRNDIYEYEEIVELIENHVRQYSAEELEELNRDRRQAGVTAYRHEDFINSQHGKVNMQQPWWTVSTLEENTPPTPFTSDEKNGVLDGIKVLELSCVIAGPAIGRILAEYGAQVLRITNSKTPDVPFFQIDGNMGKRVADLDLKTDQGREHFSSLLADADVLIDGYRPGVLDRLGFGLDMLTELAKQRGKGIVYVDETCFGHQGEWAGRPGWQQIADCLTGVAWEQGKFMGRQTPIVSPFPVADYGAGCMGAITALNGLYYRAQHGGSYHGKVSLMQFNLLLLALGKYPESVQASMRASLPPEFFQLRYCDTVDRSSKLALSAIQAAFPEFAHPSDRTNLTEKWYSHGYGGEIEVVQPVTDIHGVKGGFMRATRPNGTDQASWGDFGALGLDYRII